ncbi:hypothetical protein [Paenibacillus chitinolyticus]|uniref:hypothetical protein n=1 Tax=Paenibacillus chitinolyticus TaxID=79263 RepID=UPI003CFC4ED0
MDVIFAKYTRERLPEYQIATYFAMDHNKKVVLKKPLRKEAEEHVLKMYKTYNWLKREYGSISIVECSLIDKQVSFEFLEGKSLDTLLLNAARKNDVSLFNEHIHSYLTFVRKFGATKESKATIRAPFFEVSFVGPLELIKIANVDLIFENLISCQNTFTIIDYEWVFECSIPLNYLLYRSFLLFYHKHQEELIHFIPLEELMEAWQIDSAQITTFDAMEKAFQKYVMGTAYEYAFSKQYLQPTERLKELKAKVNDLELVIDKFKEKLILQESELQETKLLHRELSKQVDNYVKKPITIKESLIEEREEKEHLSIRLLEQETEIVRLKQLLNQDEKLNGIKEILYEIFNLLNKKRGIDSVFQTKKALSNKSMIIEFLKNIEQLFNTFESEDENYKRNINYKISCFSLKIREYMEETNKLTRLNTQQQNEYEKILQQNHINFVGMQHFKNLYEEQLHVQNLYEELKKTYHITFQELQKYK